MEMIVGGSFCINSQITKLSLDLREPKLIQKVRYDPKNNAIVDNIVSEKIYFDLTDINVTRYDNIVFIHKPEVTVAYKINENNSISRIDHLYIGLVNGSEIFLHEESVNSYYNILINIPKEYIDGVFININGTYTHLKSVDWAEEFTKTTKVE